MQFINKRHLVSLLKRLGPLWAITDIAAQESHGQHRDTSPLSHPTPRPSAWKARTLLLQSAPEDYAAALDAWRKSLEPTSLAGIVIEGPREK